MQSYLKNLIAKHYEIPNDDFFQEKELPTIEDFNILMKGLKKKDIRTETVLKKRTDDRLNVITQLLPTNFKPANILDIGAGESGDIAKAIGNHYNLPAHKIFALDPKLKERPGLISLEYIDENIIPLPDKSVDLIILFMVLHHIDPVQRIFLVDEIKRILSPTGIIIIREHALGASGEGDEFTHFIELVHEFWYIFNDEERDELYLISQNEVEDLLKLKSLKSTPVEGVQNIYHQTFSLYEYKDSASQNNKNLIMQKYNELPRTEQSLNDIFKNLGQSLPNELKNRDLQDDFEWFQIMKIIVNYIK